MVWPATNKTKSNKANHKRLTDNNITTLDISHNPKLRALWATGNPLESLDISANPSLSDYETDEGVLVKQ